MNLIFSIELFNEKLGEILNDDEVIRKKKLHLEPYLLNDRTE